MRRSKRSSPSCCGTALALDIAHCLSSLPQQPDRLLRRALALQPTLHRGAAEPQLEKERLPGGAVGQAMLRRKHGRIINLTGVLGGLRGFAGMSLYSAAKSGLAGFTRSLAREWAPRGITVNAIAPGVFPDREHLSREEYDTIERTYLPQIPVGRFGQARELGQLARYLASDASSYLTGQVFAFDGGLSA